MLRARWHRYSQMLFGRHVVPEFVRRGSHSMPLDQPDGVILSDEEQREIVTLAASRLDIMLLPWCR
jgi:hypothetical protein